MPQCACFALVSLVSAFDLELSHLSCLISSLQTTYAYYHLKHNFQGDKQDCLKPKGLCIECPLGTETASYVRPAQSPRRTSTLYYFRNQKLYMDTWCQTVMWMSVYIHVVSVWNDAASHVFPRVAGSASSKEFAVVALSTKLILLAKSLLYKLTQKWYFPKKKICEKFFVSIIKVQLNELSVLT